MEREIRIAEGGRFHHREHRGHGAGEEVREEIGRRHKAPLQNRGPAQAEACATGLDFHYFFFFGGGKVFDFLGFGVGELV